MLWIFIRLALQRHTCCGYSLDLPCRGTHILWIFIRLALQTHLYIVGIH